MNIYTEWLRNNKSCFSEIKENCTKKKCIIKGMIKRKIS